MNHKTIANEWFKYDILI